MYLSKKIFNFRSSFTGNGFLILLKFVMGSQSTVDQGIPLNCNFKGIAVLMSIDC